MLKELNSLLQKGSKISKVVSDVNAVNEMTKGNTRHIKHKIDNKIKNKIWGLLR